MTMMTMKYNDVMIFKICYTFPASEDTHHLPKSGKTIDPIENPNP